MKLNRRELLKLLGKVTAVSGIAAVVGLPEVSEINEEMGEVTFDYVGPSELYEGGTVRFAGDLPIEKITRWKGKTFQGRSFNTKEFCVRSGSIHPFKSITWMLDGKGSLDFYDEAHNIKVGDYVSIYNIDRRQEWISGWAGEVYANTVTLYNPLRNYLAMPQKV